MLKKKRFLAIFLVLVMIFAISACSKKEDKPTDTDKVTVAPTATVGPTATPTPIPFVGIDFEDGNYGFIELNTAPGNADKSVLSVEDFNGSKQLKVDIQEDKVPYIAIDTSSLLGDKVAEVRSIEMDVTIIYEDGTFRAVSGNVYAYSGADRKESRDPWSVYLETKNPNKAVGKLDNEAQYFVTGAKNFFVLTKETDNGKNLGFGSADLYIDNIVIRDANGNPMAVDTTVSFDKPDGFGESDWSNLTKVKDAVEIEGFNVSGDGWSQAGVNTTINAGTFDASLIKPGSILTINYTSEGSVWLVAVPVDGAPYGWTRIQQQTAVKNDSNSICQITYDQIVEALGTEDFASSLAILQGEGDAAWSIKSVTIGYEAKQLPATMNDAAIEGFEVKADGWAQAGVNTTLNGGTFDASLLKPGSVVTINYKSDGDMWLVAVPVDGAPFGWTRIQQQTAAKNDENNKCQITYEQIVEALGTEDFASYINILQCESDQAWEVYSVTIGEYAPPMVKVKDEVAIEGFEVKADGWAQAGVNTTINNGTFDASLLKPGCVVTISYNSPGNVWLVAVPGDGAPYGWTRISQGTAAKNSEGNKCQITYDQIVAALGTEDFASSMAILQAEGEQAWEVYSVTIGYPAE